MVGLLKETIEVIKEMEQVLRKSGFAIVNEKQEYLYYEQVSQFGMETYSTKIPYSAQIYETKEEAIREAHSMISGRGEWEYHYSEKNKPLGIVELKIETYVGEIEKLH